MEIIKVVVDKLPSGCDNCILCTNEYAMCQATKLDVWYTSDDGKEDLLFPYRPDWCPLVLEDEYRDEILGKFNFFET